MNNHSFATPVPVLDASVPSWDIAVYRNGVSQPVSTLRVTAEVLPPRKRKNKVVWKLPDDKNMIPKFGQYEQDRLWEIFKAQKKERRKIKMDEHSSSSQSPHVDVDDATQQVQGGSGQSGTERIINETIIASGITSEHHHLIPPGPPPGFGPVVGGGGGQRGGQPRGEGQANGSKVASLAFHSLTKEAIKMVVVETFRQCLMENDIERWVRHYAEQAQSSFLVGSAEAACSTMAERSQQWSNLARNSRWTILYAVQHQVGKNLHVTLTVSAIQGQAQKTMLNVSWSLVLTPVHDSSSSAVTTTHQYAYEIGADTVCFFPAQP